MKHRESTTDAVEILYRHFTEGKPELIAMYEKMKIDEPISREIEELRTQARLSRCQFAKIVGTTEAVTYQLEDADYEGDAQEMLHLIKKAFRQHAGIKQRLPRKIKAPQLAFA